MHTTLVMMEFFVMVFAPCLVATHAMYDEGPELGYDVTFRLVKAKAVELRGKLVDALKV